MCKKSDLTSLKNKTIDDFEFLLDCYRKGEIKPETLQNVIDMICLVQTYDNVPNNNFVAAKLLE